MLRESAPEQDRTAAVEIPWRVRQAEPLDGYCLHVVFLDGLMGTVDLSRLVNSEHAGVFAALRDPAVFRSVSLDYGAVAWPGEIDLAPDAMYAAISERGESVVG
ncbi:MAG: DUF2442 domain-containing protein [Silvibacterium sp.]|nr:DUF2442 domain-containing protein [Silvibacterium sp.]